MFGEGPPEVGDAADPGGRVQVVLVGEQPGDREDVEGRPWLRAELALLQPEVVVLLGATAAKAVLGPSVRVTRDRGRVLPGPDGQRVVATVHPSSVLRADDARRVAAFDALVADLRAVAETVGA